jgi:transcription elongation factor Elf1
MPIYEFACTCGAGTEVFCSVKEREQKIPMHCGKPMYQLMSVSQVMPDIAPYRSTIDGSIIGSRSTHRAHLKQHGCIEVGNERLKPRAPAPLPSCVPELRRAIHEVRSRK